MNRLLERQIKKFFGGKKLIPPEMWPFINAVNDAYENYDNDMALMERSFDISSQELSDYNKEMKLSIGKMERSKQQLEESRKNLKSIIDSMPFGIVVVGEDRKVIIVNEEAVRISGYDSREEMLGRDSSSFMCPPGNKEECVKNSLRKVDKEKCTILKRDGRIIPVLKSAMPIKLGDTEAFLEGFIDLSQVERTEQEKEILRAQLIQSQKMETIGTLAGGVAHDFNNILGIIFGYAEMIKKKAEKDTRLSKDIMQLLKAAEYGRDLVKQILIFSRHSDSEKKRLKLQDMLEGSLELMRASLPSTIKIKKQIKADCGEVMADDVQIRQIIANMCTNAGHAMEKNGGVLTVKLEETEITSDSDKLYIDPEMISGKYAVLTFQDTGHGMDDQTLKRIFEPFFTTKNKKGDVKGVGLGLSVIHGIVKQHGGAITVYSEPGKGTIFRVYFPVVIEKADNIGRQDDTASEGDIENGMKGKETVLFVDDEEHIVIVGKQMLEHFGYTVEGVKDAGEALEKFREDPAKYDVVITDQVMPDLTGIELAGEMLSIKPGIPIIMTTGYAENINNENYRKHGIKEFLLKPLSVKDLCVAIRRSVDHIKTDADK